MTFSVYEKRLPEDDVNISKHVGILYDTILLLIYCVFVGLNSKIKNSSTCQDLSAPLHSVTSQKNINNISTVETSNIATKTAFCCTTEGYFASHLVEIKSVLTCIWSSSQYETQATSRRTVLFCVITTTCCVITQKNCALLCYY